MLKGLSLSQVIWLKPKLLGPVRPLGVPCGSTQSPIPATSASLLTTKTLLTINLIETLCFQSSVNICPALWMMKPRYKESK